jgi:hypothetical protein
MGAFGRSTGSKCNSSRQRPRPDSLERSGRAGTGLHDRPAIKASVLPQPSPRIPESWPNLSMAMWLAEQELIAAESDAPTDKAR